MKTWLMHHLHALQTALSRLVHAPFASFFTLISLGITLSLPAIMAIVLLNVQQLGGALPTQGAITVYLRTDASAADLAQLEDHIQHLDKLAHKQFVPRKQALSQLSSQLSLGDLTSVLPDNPLPDAWILTPDRIDPQLTQRWTHELGTLPMVAQIQGDQLWITRLQALLKLGEGMVILLSGLLAVGLVTISGIIIRLQILSRLPEIQVSRLIGATDAFISRPFLYFGLVEGGIAGLLASGIVYAGVSALNAPITALAHLYASSFAVHLPEPTAWLAFVAGSSILGWLGAWLAVQNTLE